MIFMILIHDSGNDIQDASHEIQGSNDGDQCVLPGFDSDGV